MHWSSALRAAARNTQGRGAVLLSAFALACAVLPAQQPAAPRFLVVLDAAHGGDDAGGRLASGKSEKDATLSLSVRLRSLLAARGIAVVTTREADTALDADRRAGIANHARAAACLSLHVTESGSGIHLFTSDLAPLSPAPRFLAWKTAQAAWLARSLALSGSLNSALQRANINVTLGRTALPAVDSMTCPAVALELAPERDAKGAVTAEPDDPDYQSRIASTLAAALLDWRSNARTEARQP